MSAAYLRSELRKPVLPSEITVCIREAIKAGWQSKVSGKQFVFKATEEFFTN